MIFPKSTVGKIVRGEITHVLRPGNTRPPALNARVFVKASQHDPVACHILIREVRVRTAGEVDYEWARLLGYRTTDEFRTVWVETHDPRAVEIATDAGLYDAALLEHFERHAGRRVFIVRFELDRTERPRLLADRNARTDYVEDPARALSHEPEAVDQVTQARFSREGHQGWVAREKQRELDRERLAADERLRRVQLEARAAGVDIGHIEAGILQRLRAAERKIHQRKAA